MRIRFGRSFFLVLPLLLASGSSVSPQEPPPGAPSVAPSSTPSLAHAQQMFRTGNLDSASQEYQALSSGTDAAFAYVGIARVDLKRKQPADAYAAVTKAMELAPHAPDVQVALGEVYYRQGKIPEAEVQFVNVINSGAENARAYLGLARVSNAASLYRRGKQMIDRAPQPRSSGPGHHPLLDRHIADCRPDQGSRGLSRTGRHR